MAYFGYKYDEFYNLEVPIYLHLIELYERAKAQDNLELLELFIYKDVDKNNREQIHKKLTKTATPMAELEKRAIRTDDLASVFGGSIEDILRKK